jgi:hypothetical protein
MLTRNLRLEMPSRLSLFPAGDRLKHFWLSLSYAFASRSIIPLAQPLYMGKWASWQAGNGQAGNLGKSPCCFYWCFF